MAKFINLIIRTIKFLLFFPIRHYIIFSIHCLICFILSLIIYMQVKPFFSKKNEQLHKTYYYFRRLDNFNYPRLLIGLIFLVVPRGLLFVLSFIVMAFAVNIGKNILDPKDKWWKDKIYQYGSRVVLFALGCVFPKEIRLQKDVENIYKKYLGPDYSISYNEKFSSVLCNHVSWVESFFFNCILACGYVGKKTASKVPGISHLGRYNQTIYCDRQSAEDRQLAAQKIMDRQKGLMDGTILTQIAIYPEGTMSNGTNLIKFKRGAFMSLLPLKPYLEIIDQTEELTLAVGALPMHWHIVMSCCYLWHNVTFVELPVVKPTEFMYEKYKEFGEEKWMIYMNVVKCIMAECGGFQKCEATFKPEKLDYLSAIKGKKVKNT